MATVFQARQPSLDRVVALKILSPELARDADYVARFRQEATTAAQLEHPNIVPIYDFGQADGHLYITMRYVRGGSLAQLIQQEGQLPLDRALPYLSQVAAALDYAHSRGVVHRDLKPANILLEDGAHGATLADFGIARTDQGPTRLTRLGSIAGTPQYMAPEQVLGNPVDFRADLYALGIVAYELLAGTAPFEAPSAVAVLHKQAYDPPASLRLLRPDLPEAIDHTIARMLAKRADERFQSGAEFIAALHAASGDGPSGPDSPRTRARRHSRHGPVWAMPVVAATGALAAVVVTVALVGHAAGPTLVDEDSPKVLPTSLPTATATPVSTSAPFPTLIATQAPPVATSVPTPTALPARLALGASDLSPRSAHPGDALTLTYEINNPGPLPIEAILGATLRFRGGGPDLNDPEDDQPVTVQPGTQTYQRVFKLPTGVADGSYDVLWGVMGSDRKTSYGLQTGSAVLRIASPTAVTVSPQVSASAVALPAIDQANRVWAAVVAENGGPVSNLANVYGGRWLETIRSEVETMRARGQYRTARMVAPTTLRSATFTSSDVIEAFTTEQWDDRTYNRDGSLVRVAPGHVEQRYVLQRSGNHWLVVDSQIDRSWQ